MLLVELHQFRVEFLFVVFKFFLQLDDFGLDILHPLHGFITFILQGHEQQFNPAGQDNNGPPEIVRILIDRPEH